MLFRSKKTAAASTTSHAQTAPSESHDPDLDADFADIDAFLGPTEGEYTPATAAAPDTSSIPPSIQSLFDGQTAQIASLGTQLSSMDEKNASEFAALHVQLTGISDQLGLIYALLQPVPSSSAALHTTDAPHSTDAPS